MLVIGSEAKPNCRRHDAFFNLYDINNRLTPEVSSLIYAHLYRKAAILKPLCYILGRAAISSLHDPPITERH